jgi:acetyl esterase/lipase
MLRPLLAITTLGVLACAAPEERLDVVYDARRGDAGLLDVYLPADGATTHATVLFIHGGGWRFGSKEHFQIAARRLAASGFVVASINYSLLPSGVFPRNAQDAICALAYLRGHAAELTIDPDRIAVMGYSAGAHLAALVGLAADHPELQPTCDAAAAVVARPAAVIAASGPMDMHIFREGRDPAEVDAIFGGSPTELPHAYDLGSPRWHVAPGAPPFLLMQDTVDFGGIAAMRDDLAAAGADVRMLKVRGSLHVLEPGGVPGSYEFGVASETPEAWIAVEDFLYRTIGREVGP